MKGLGEHPVIEMFWEVVLAFTEAERRLFFSFVTGEARRVLCLSLSTYLSSSPYSLFLWQEDGRPIDCSRFGSRAYQRARLHQDVRPAQRTRFRQVCSDYQGLLH